MSIAPSDIKSSRQCRKLGSVVISRSGIGLLFAQSQVWLAQRDPQPSSRQTDAKLFKVNHFDIDFLPPPPRADIRV